MTSPTQILSPFSAKVTPDPWLTHASTITPTKRILIVGFKPDEDYVNAITKNIINAGTRIQTSLIEKRKFSSGEFNFVLPHSRGYEVFIVWRVENDVNADILALELLVQAFADTCAAEKVHVLAPYYPYSRSDKLDTPHTPIGATWVQRLYRCQPTVMRTFVTLDLHSGQTASLVPRMCNLYLRNYILGIIDDMIESAHDSRQFVFIAPDAGAAKATEKYAKHYGLPIVIISKIRDSNGQLETSLRTNQADLLRPLLDGKHGILIDDMFDTMGTVGHAAKIAAEAGLKVMTAIGSHGVLSKGSAFLDEDDRFAIVDRVYVSDSLPLSTYGKSHSAKVRVYSSADAMSKAIYCIATGSSISDMFGL